jgi:S-DNA-T family DNA segregation ATPase FtsK/SpoIIIE
MAGYVSIFLTLWLAFCSFRGIGVRTQLVRWIGALLASGLVAISCHLLFRERFPEVSLLQGGLVGRTVGHWLYQYFNTTGALLLVAGGFIVTFIMTTGIFLSRWVHWLWVDEETESAETKNDARQSKTIQPIVRPVTLAIPSAPPTRAHGSNGKKHKRKATVANSQESDDAELTEVDENSDGEISGSEEKATEPDSDSGELVSTDFSFQELIPVESSSSLPSTRLLKGGDGGARKLSKSELKENARKLCEHLLSFQITGEVVDIRQGPVLTTYEFKPNAGMKLSRIAALQDDLGVLLGTQELRVVAPIPGKTVVGIEVARPETEIIALKDMLSDDSFYDKKIKVPIAIGKSTTGEPVFSDLTAMPHLLVAGATGSGKSVFINSLVMSLLYRLSPQELRLILIDPKMLELSVFDGIPHLITKVITHNAVAYNALAWAVLEMERRYQRMSESGSKNIDSYNSKHRSGKLPYIVIVVDELADLMFSGGERVEIAITRLAQKARAAGIHLVIATQRPSTDVVTGLIKANIPSRISFKVPSSIDSRTVLDTSGAEDLIGRGDSLMIQPGTPLRRLHGCFVTEEELARVVKHITGSKDNSKHYMRFPDTMPPEEE